MKKVWEFIREHPLIVVIVVLFVAYQVFGDALPSINLEQALEDISDSLGKWTYAVVGALAFLETGAFVGLVFPGETAVVLAGAIAGNGTTSIVVTIAMVWVSAWLGDTASFYIGKRLGKDFILRHGPQGADHAGALRAGGGLLRPLRRQDDPGRAGSSGWCGRWRRSSRAARG